MSYRESLNKLKDAGIDSTPLSRRQHSTASNSSYTHPSDASILSRNSTVSSTASSGYPQAGHKRGLSEARGMSPPIDRSSSRSPDKATPKAEDLFANLRMSLRPLRQEPSSKDAHSPPSHKQSVATSSHSRIQSLDLPPSRASYNSSVSSPTRPASSIRPTSLLMSRADSARPSSSQDPHDHAQNHMLPHAPLVAPDLESLGKSTTGHLRTLSKFAESASPEIGRAHV